MVPYHASTNSGKDVGHTCSSQLAIEVDVLLKSKFKRRSIQQQANQAQDENDGDVATLTQDRHPVRGQKTIPAQRLPGKIPWCFTQQETLLDGTLDSGAGNHEEAVKHKNTPNHDRGHCQEVMGPVKADQ